MSHQSSDIMAKIGQTAGIAVLIYLTTWILLVGVSAIDESLNPLLAVLLGLVVVFLGLSVYYWQNPDEIAE